MEEAIKILESYKIYLASFIDFNDDFIIKNEYRQATVRDVSIFYKKMMDPEQGHFPIIVRLLQDIEKIKKDKRLELAKKDKSNIKKVYDNIKHVVQTYIIWIKNNFNRILEEPEEIKKRFYKVKGILVESIERLESIQKDYSYV